MKTHTAKRLRDDRGESMVESLFSMLIIVLAALMLAGAAVSSARVNAGAAKAALFPQYAGENGSEPTARLSGGFLEGSSIIIPLRGYEDEGGLAYYEAR